MTVAAPTWATCFRRFVTFLTPIAIRSANRWAGCFPPGNAPQSVPISHCLQINGKLNSTDASRPKRPAGNSGQLNAHLGLPVTANPMRRLQQHVRKIVHRELPLTPALVAEAVHGRRNPETSG